MATTHKLAAVITDPQNDAVFLLVKQTRPPKFGDSEYDSFVDSDLWDLPSASLTAIENGGDEVSQSQPLVDSCATEIDLRKFDLNLALDQILSQAGICTANGLEWRFMKFMKEPDFGPGIPAGTVYISGRMGPQDGNLKEDCKWMSNQSCLASLLEVKPNSDRVGPLIVLGLINDSMQPVSVKIPPSISFQEYPPGVKIIPMESRTQKPFRTTNLVVFSPGHGHEDYGSDNFVARGDALIIDPGCRSKHFEELKDIVTSLPRKLIVFLTHHHYDHVDGLSTIQKCNPEATLLAHENTMLRIKKEDWSLGYTSVSGDEEVCIGGQKLKVVFAPGHTDGHVALLHVSTNSLVVGDHCVGQGSAILDINSGGNMSDYFQTTYNFLKLSPHALIPMHGRINLWPKHMLCGYLKNRRKRESAVLKAIEDGSNTLFDIVAYVYSEVDRSFWVPAASNVRLHVDYLAQQDKLPKEFSIRKFQSTCGIHFLSRWMWAYMGGFLSSKDRKLRAAQAVGVIAVAGIAVLCSVRNKFISK